MKKIYILKASPPIYLILCRFLSSSSAAREDGISRGEELEKYWKNGKRFVYPIKFVWRKEEIPRTPRPAAHINQSNDVLLC